MTGRISCSQTMSNLHTVNVIRNRSVRVAQHPHQPDRVLLWRFRPSMFSSCSERFLQFEDKRLYFPLVFLLAFSLRFWLHGAAPQCQYELMVMSQESARVRGCELQFYRVGISVSRCPCCAVLQGGRCRGQVYRALSEAIAVVPLLLRYWLITVRAAILQSYGDPR